MENPATWGKAERIINDTMVQAMRAQAEGVYGLSMARQVADALRAANLLKPEDQAEDN